MATQKPLVVWFEAVDKNDGALVGGKGANLGELVQAGIPVPPGFIVTTDAYREFLRSSKLDSFIDQQLQGLDPEDTKLLQEKARIVQEAVLAAPISATLVGAVRAAYQQLTLMPGGSIFVAVRSSATAEDLPEASFAGQQASFLNILGSEAVLATIRQIWASLFSPRAIYYRAVHGFSHQQLAMAVPVQAMVQADVAGVLFTLEPMTNDKSVIAIDAVWGLGSTLDSGALTPDRYLVQKDNGAIIERFVSTQTWKLGKKPGSSDTAHIPVPAQSQHAQKLTDDQIVELARLGAKIEAHYQFPQDTEWLIANNRIFFVHARPVTTVKKQVAVRGEHEPVSSAAAGYTPLLSGTAASLGIATGPVRILHSPAEIDRIEPGDILVAEVTSPDYVPAMRKAAAIVTDAGGRTSHAAIVSRELGIPAVVGAGTASHVLKDGQVITVDGANGKIYQGAVGLTHAQAAAVPQVRRGTAYPSVKTATKLYVNLAEPSRAADVSKMAVDGVGLLRAEFMVAALGEHPKAMVQAGRRSEYVAKLTDGMAQFAKAFHPHPVVYRGTDFKTNEYRSLKGGDPYEPHEENPMLGYRGAFRYVTDPDLFNAELEAITALRTQQGLDNLYLMIPFVRTVDELKQVKALVDAAGLTRDRTFKLWMMVEVPSNVILIEEFLAVGIQGVSIGTNDLTQLTLGADRDNAKLAEVFDERDPAVLWSVQRVIDACRKANVTVSVCGQAPSTYPEFAEMLVKKGVTSISVNPDVIDQTRQLIASVEQQLHSKAFV